MTQLGLPDTIRACLFDLDGVLTQTAKVHSAAWKEMFDVFLKTWSQRSGQPFVPFDEVADYDRFVDGKPRFDGVASFLDSRGIQLPEGTHSDPPAAETIGGLGNRKNEIVQGIIHDKGVDAYPGSVRYVHAVIDAGLALAVVSSSTNTHEVLKAAGLAELFGVVVDGHVAAQKHLKGKPAPDTFLAGAQALGVPAGAAAAGGAPIG